MPHTRILIHTVWATKDRKPLMTMDTKDAICGHIVDYSQSKGIYLLNINGWTDHIHCLISLSADQTVATVMQLLKGESAYWANRTLEFTEHFGWQDEYFAVSVSESQRVLVSQYITNQEKHHQTKSFADEYDEFMQQYSFERKGLKG